VPDPVPAFLRQAALFERGRDQTNLHVAALWITAVRAEGEQLEMVRLFEQRTVGPHQVAFRDVLGETAIAGVLLDPSVDGLAEIEEPAVVSEVLEGHDI